MEPFTDYYELLGVPPTASAEVIEQAFHTLAKRYHPDLNPDPTANVRFLEINQAYTVLKHPDRRKLYDETWIEYSLHKYPDRTFLFEQESIKRDARTPDPSLKAAPQQTSMQTEQTTMAHPPAQPASLLSRLTPPGLRRAISKQPAWRWLVIGGILLIVLGLTGLLPGSDWAGGSRRLGLAALAEGVIVFIVFLARCKRPIKARAFLSGLLLATLLLLTLGGGAIGAQNLLHRAQGLAQQRAGDFAAAIQEFQLAADIQDEANAYLAWGQQLQGHLRYAQAVQTLQRSLQLPLPVELQHRIQQALAYTYYLWGRQLEQQGQYRQATDTFNNALTLPQPAAEQQQTRQNLAQTYYLWGKQLAAQGQYEQAAYAFQQALGQPLPSVEVQQAQEDFAENILAWGVQLLGMSDYEAAINAFQEVLQDPQSFGKTSPFLKIYRDAANAYLQLGLQQQAQRDCANAAASFRTLIQHFSDTPQARRASAELRKPQNVTGTIIGLDGKPAANVRLFLSRNYHLVSSSQFTASNDYTTVSDARGNFTFTNIPPGDQPYLVSYLNALGEEETRVNLDSMTFVYLVTVQPLCATSAGEIDESII